MSSSFTALVTPSSEHLCYIPCNFCNILLAVNVPSSSMLETVTVRCERCTNMSSVNMAASIRSISMPEFQVPKSDYGLDVASTSKTKNKIPMRAQTVNTIDRMVNRLPEKRQRVPSAYNQFIKEEIQRIKANNSGISHREAFSTAAKNWAHFPHTHYGLMLETTNKQPRLDTNCEKRSSMSMPALFK